MFNHYWERISGKRVRYAGIQLQKLYFFSGLATTKNWSIVFEIFTKEAS